MNTIVVTETYSEVHERQNKTEKKQTHKEKKEKRNRINTEYNQTVNDGVAHSKI